MGHTPRLLHTMLSLRVNTASAMITTVWKAWAPPKCKFFAWLIIHNRVWTADRLQRRGWSNCNLCPLCKQVQETAAHLLFQCRFTVRVWTEIKTWLGLHDIDPSDWRLVPSVKVCWDMVAHKRGHSRMVRSTLMMLVAWEI